MKFPVRTNLNVLFEDIDIIQNWFILVNDNHKSILWTILFVLDWLHNHCLSTLWDIDKMAAIWPDDILKCIFSNWMQAFGLKFHWSLFLGVQLTILQHLFRLWLGADQATSLYLNQWWPRLSTHICVTPQRVKGVSICCRRTIYLTQTSTIWCILLRSQNILYIRDIQI